MPRLQLRPTPTRFDPDDDEDGDIIKTEKLVSLIWALFNCWNSRQGGEHIWWKIHCQGCFSFLCYCCCALPARGRILCAEQRTREAGGWGRGCSPSTRTPGPSPSPFPSLPCLLPLQVCLSTFQSAQGSPCSKLYKSLLNKSYLVGLQEKVSNHRNAF